MHQLNRDEPSGLSNALELSDAMTYPPTTGVFERKLLRLPGDNTRLKTHRDLADKADPVLLVVQVVGAHKPIAMAASCLLKES